MPLEEFFTGYRKTVLRRTSSSRRSTCASRSTGAIVTWRKVGTRLAQAISKVALAAAIEWMASGVVTRARFGMASVGPVTAPLASVRQLAEGKALASIDASADRSGGCERAEADRRRAEHGGVPVARGEGAGLEGVPGGGRDVTLSRSERRARASRRRASLRPNRGSPSPRRRTPRSPRYRTAGDCTRCARRARCSRSRCCRPSSRG